MVGGLRGVFGVIVAPPVDQGHKKEADNVTTHCHNMVAWTVLVKMVRKEIAVTGHVLVSLLASRVCIGVSSMA